MIVKTHILGKFLLGMMVILTLTNILGVSSVPWMWVFCPLWLPLAVAGGLILVGIAAFVFVFLITLTLFIIDEVRKR